MDGSAWVFFVVLLGATGAAGALVMSGKGQSPVIGFALGFFLGLIGVLICALVPKSMDKRIAEQIEFDARMRRIQGIPPESVDVPRTPSRRMGGES